LLGSGHRIPTLLKSQIHVNQIDAESVNRHQATNHLTLCFYDSKTALSFTGDFFMPGRLLSESQIDDIFNRSTVFFSEILQCWAGLCGGDGPDCFGLTNLPTHQSDNRSRCLTDNQPTP
jgi:hypothetical protein